MVSDNFFQQIAKVDTQMYELVKGLSKSTWRLPTYKTESAKKLKLVEIIIGQQISAKAAESIWQRLQVCLRENQSPQSCYLKAGISRPKIAYIKGLESLNLTALESLDDQSLKAELLAYKGIGEWTAAMILIFIYQRRDVFAWSDLILKRAAAQFYTLSYQDDQQFKQLQLKIENLKPYRSLIALALWRSYSKK